MDLFTEPVEPMVDPVSSAMAALATAEISNEARPLSSCGAAFVCHRCCNVGLELDDYQDAGSKRLTAMDLGDPLRDCDGGSACVARCAGATRTATSRRHPGRSRGGSASHGSFRRARRFRSPTPPGGPVNCAWLYDAALGGSRSMAVPARACNGITTRGHCIRLGRIGCHVQSSGLRL